MQLSNFKMNLSLNYEDDILFQRKSAGLKILYRYITHQILF